MLTTGLKQNSMLHKGPVKEETENRFHSSELYQNFWLRILTLQSSCGHSRSRLS